MVQVQYPIIFFMPSLTEITQQITKLDKHNKELYYNNQKLLDLISKILQVNKDPNIDKLIKDYLVNNQCL